MNTVRWERQEDNSGYVAYVGNRWVGSIYSTYGELRGKIFLPGAPEFAQYAPKYALDEMKKIVEESIVEWFLGAGFTIDGITTEDSPIAQAHGYAPGDSSSTWAHVQIRWKNSVTLEGRKKLIIPEGEYVVEDPDSDRWGPWSPVGPFLHFVKEDQYGRVWFPRGMWQGNAEIIQCLFSLR